MAFERDSRTWNQFRWTPRLKRLLGKVTDRDLAEIAGVHFQTVVKERRRRGIPPAVPRRERIRWTNAMIALLGTDYDRNVAASLRLDKGSVYRKRRSLGIKPFGRSTHTDEVRWTPKMDRLLGRMPDGDVAKRLRRKRPAVAYRRLILGIRPFRPAPTPVRWTPAMARLLGKHPDREVAERLGIAPKAVRLERERRRIPAIQESRSLKVNRALAALLRRPNAEVSRVAGISHGTIARLRKRLSIRPPRTPSAWTAEALRRLGREPDESIARRLALKKSTVARKRQQLGRQLVGRWTAREDALLGSAADPEVARRLRRSARRRQAPPPETRKPAATRLLCDLIPRPTPMSPPPSPRLEEGSSWS